VLLFIFHLNLFRTFRHLAELAVAVRARLEQVPKERRIRFWHHTSLELYYYLAFRKL